MSQSVSTGLYGWAARKKAQITFFFASHHHSFVVLSNCSTLFCRILLPLDNDGPFFQLNILRTKVKETRNHENRAKMRIVAMNINIQKYINFSSFPC